MRISLLLLFAVFITACSTVESTRLDVDNREVANFDVVDWVGSTSGPNTNRNNIMDSKGNKDYYEDNRKFVDDVSGSDWRTQSILNNPLIKSLINNPNGFAFKYRVRYGKNYWLNFRFDPNSKEVSYALATDTEVIQLGKTTVWFLLKADNKVQLSFDVDFLSETQFPAGYKDILIEDTGAKFYRAAIRGSNSQPYGGSYVDLYDWWSRAAILKRRDNTSGGDWRGFHARKNNLFHWLIRPYAHRTFNFRTNPDGEKFWFNYTFFDHRKDVWYQIVSSKKGVLQSGWTTVGLRSLQTSGLGHLGCWKGTIEFHVSFFPGILSEKTVLVVGKGYNYNYKHRGYLVNYVITKNPKEFNSKFGVIGGHKSF